MAEIDDHYAALGGAISVLGVPIGPETSTPDGDGRFRHYVHGSIYWTALTGAHEVHGAIHAAWSGLGWELGVLGYPLTDETAGPGGGRFNRFQAGSISWTEQTGAHEVHGAIGALWMELGAEAGALGYPLSNELTTEHRGSQVNHFRGGDIYWDPHRGAYEVLPRPAFATTGPAIGGRWDKAAFDAGISGLHAALLPVGAAGAVWFLSYHDPTGHGHHSPEPAGLGESRVVDLNTRPPTVTTPTYEGAGAVLPNLFCGGHAFLADGRLLMVGGDREDQDRLRMLHTFTPGGSAGGTWRRIGPMAEGRWYPTAVTLPDGRVLIIGGEKRVAGAANANTSYEIVDPETDRVGPQVPVPLQQLGTSITYPFVFVLPTGELMVHGGTHTVFLDLATFDVGPDELEAVHRPDRNSRTYGVQGTSVLLPLLPDASPAYRARVMMIGGGGGGPVGMRTPATSSCEILDLGAPSPAWSPTTSLAAGRVMPDAVLLPDGSVMVMSGSSRGFADNGANPVWESEMFDPVTETWSPMAHTSVPRLYHATALLLPDATVMTSGTDATWNPETIPASVLDLEIFSPPYLFTGLDRPTITSAPEHMGYDTSFLVHTPDAASVTSVALMRDGSCTHSFNSDQRHVGLTIAARGPEELTLTTPPDGSVAPPGWYMLFLLREGVPCERAWFVHVG